MSRRDHAGMFGPTTGDRVRLADTELVVEVERDLTVPGEEVTFGGGKVIRDGMGQSQASRAEGAVDTVITNALVICASGIFKADIGLKDGLIAALGKAGNPDTQDGVDHRDRPLDRGDRRRRQDPDRRRHGRPRPLHLPAADRGRPGVRRHHPAGRRHGPATGTNATTCTPGAWHIGRMLQAADAFPVNLGFAGKGNSSTAAGLVEQVEAGACALKLHEDWGTTPAAIDCCLGVADAMDVQVDDPHRHAERGGLRRGKPGRDRRAHDPRLPHRGCGRWPCARHHPHGGRDQRAAELDQPDAAVHGQHARRAPRHADGVPSPGSRIPEDVAFAESRIRPQTIAAEDILHDLGAISIIASDSQAMGRVGEVLIRTFQTADKMKRQRGRLAGESGDNDNLRVRRYMAKVTINPAIAHGMADLIGTVEPGKRADLVLWEPAFFGVKPALVLVGGSIAAAPMGDPNASIPTPQPVHYRPMFGAFGRAREASSVTFVSRAAQDASIGERLGLAKRTVAVTGTRGLGKTDMVLNDALPTIEVDPETYEVRADGVLLTCEPATVLPMAQRYFLF